MKKLLLSVLAIFALVACNRDEVVSEQSQSFISFGDSFVEVKTRAAVDPSTTTNTITAFDVWGFIGQPSGTVFEKERVTKGAEGWSYNNLQWWVADKTYYFHAISPVDDSNIKVDTQDMNVAGLGNIAFTNVNGTTDLLYATEYVTTGKDYPYYNEKVTMQFMHLLSKIKFTFKNGFTNENASLAVKNIVITDAPAEGNIDVNKERKDFVWNLTQNKTTKLEFGDVNGGKSMPLYNPEDVKNGVVDVESAVERLTIPADATRSYTIEFDLELYYGDQLGMTSNRSITLENQAFAIGKNYNLVATITPENFVDGGLMPIVFDVEVEEWVDGDFNGGFDFDDNGTNDGDDDDDNNDEPTVETYKLYFNNAQAWSKVYVYAWDSANTELFGQWPGVEITAKESVEGVEYFAYTLPAELTGKTINLIFNNGEGQQTADIEDVLVNENRFYTNYVEPTPGPEPTDTVLYLTPNANWKQANARFAAYFFDNGEKWVDMTLVEGETDIYSVVVPDGFEDVIFVRMNPSTTTNSWDNNVKWNQTSDLKVPTDGTNHYTVAEGAWDKGAGTWSTYTPAVAAPTALATPVVTAVAKENTVTLTWEAVENAASYSITVGTEMPVVTEELTYTFTGEYETEYTFNVVAVPADEVKFAASAAGVVTATTEAAPVAAYTTVAEFLAADVNDTTFYTLKGTITRVANTSYGNFDLTDETGTIYVYGLYSEDGATNKYWAASGAKLGDDIVISAVRADYNGSAQAGSARFLGLTSPGTLAFYTVSTNAVDFASAGGEQVVNVTAYNIDAAVTATSDNSAFAVSVDGYNVTISAAANELEEEVTGNIAIKVGDLAETVVKASLAAKPAAGVVEGGSSDFHTISNTNTSYVSGETTAGWAYTNCAIFKGGTSDSSPAFVMIGDASNRALCMNGKTTAVGTITSPTITTGCGTLKFNYGLPFGDTKIKFTVEIMQNGAVVKTFTVDEPSATKLTKYSFEEAIDVAGEFQIVFKNLSPSNSTSNKDRTAIWDVEWTGCN